MTIEIILQKYDLLDIANGKTQCPDESSHALVANVAAWKTRDLNARLELLTNMEDAIKLSLRALNTSNEIWERLKQSYEHKDVASQIANLKKLMNTSCSEDQEIPQYVESWRLLMDETLLSGVALDPQVQAMLLLASLPPSWQSFITTKTTANMSIPLLVPTILQEHTMRTSIASTSHAPPMAMLAKSSRFHKPTRFAKNPTFSHLPH